MAKVFVVMGNDFPDSVWDTEEKAVSYCNQRSNEPKSKGEFGVRIYWRVYPFTLNQGYVNG